MIKVAYLCNPHIGGTFSFFKRMRPALRAHGIDFVCLGTGVRDGDSGVASGDGIQLVELPTEPTHAMAMLVDVIVNRGFNAVMGIAGSEEHFANLFRFLPKRISTVTRIGNMTQGAYRPARLMARHSDKVVAVAERVRTDLLQSGIAHEGQLVTIWNGISTISSTETGSRDCFSDVFRVVYVGRLNDYDKGVLYLPRIVSRVKSAVGHVQMDVVGDGPDTGRLLKAIQKYGLQSDMVLHGAVAPGQAVELMKTRHCFIMPSRFEGCPNALLEAMSVGCVPVASHLRHCTDLIIKNGVTGFTVPVGDVGVFSDRLVALARDRAMLASMSQEVGRDTAERFALMATAQQYAHLFQSLAQTVSMRSDPLSVADFSVPRELLPTWRRCVPVAMKKTIRKFAERFGYSV
jgi:glycosyltransferase involved in cell wall biosynthesis